VRGEEIINAEYTSTGPEEIQQEKKENREHQKRII